MAAATIFEGSRQVLDSIWEKNNHIWPEWLWEVYPATFEVINKKRALSNKRKDKPIVAAGRSRIVIWTSRPLTLIEKEMIPSQWSVWKVVVESGSQVAYNRFLKRVEAEEAATADPS